MISFKGAHYPKNVILYAIFFYVRHGVSYRDIEAIMDERGVKVDHSTLNRWVINHSSSLVLAAKKFKRAVATSWRMDETYIKVKGKWVYLYRAVDKFGDTLGFMLFKHRDKAAASTFFKQAIDTNGFPNKVVMDKSGANRGRNEKGARAFLGTLAKRVPGTPQTAQQWPRHCPIS